MQASERGTFKAESLTVHELAVTLYMNIDPLAPLGPPAARRLELLRSRQTVGIRGSNVHLI